MSDLSAANPHRFYGTVAGVLGGLAIALGVAELWGLSPARIGAGMLGACIVAYVAVAWLCRQTTPEAFHLGASGLPPFYLGLAGSVDWLGIVFLVAVPALVYSQGSIGLAIVLGAGAGYVLIGSLLAPALARSGRPTLPDFLALRYETEAIRVLAAVMLTVVGIGFAAAQVAALASLGVRLFGLDPHLIQGAMLIAVIACALAGGAGSLRAQVVQAIVVVVGVILPVLILSARFMGVPAPFVMYGPVVQRVELMEATAGLGGGIAAVADGWTFLGVAGCLAFGIAVLPQLLSRELAARDMRRARRATNWSLIVVVLILITLPAYAAFVRSEVLANVLGQPISALPNWIAAWSGPVFTAAAVCDGAALMPATPLCAGLPGDGNGLIGPAEFRLLPDALLLITPAVADLPFTITALAAAGIATAALAAVTATLNGVASTLAVDLARRPQSIAAVRIAVVAVAAIAIGIAGAFEIDGLRLALAVLALGACGLFPVLVLAIWSRRCGAAAAIAGMLVGFLFCLAVLLGGSLVPRPGSVNLDRIAMAMLGLPIGFVVLWLAIRFSAPAGPAAQAFVDRIRRPRRR